MQEPTLTPLIHKRSSSLPHSRAIIERDEEAGPVPPLKVGRHNRLKSNTSQHEDSLGFFIDPWLVRPQGRPPSTPPEIPERHLGRQLLGDYMHKDDARRQSSGSYGSEYSSGVEEVPSLISISSDGSDMGRFTDSCTQMLHNCIRELYLSERQFCVELSVAVHELMQKTMDVGLAERHMAILFHNLPAVYGISTGLVRLMEQYVPEQILFDSGGPSGDLDEPTQVGRAMCAWLNSDMYRVYELYVHGNRAQAKMFQRLASKHGSLHMCIGENSLPLRSLLQKPVQRISQYPIYLKAMLDLIPPHHPDACEISHAYERARKYCHSINARIG